MKPPKQCFIWVSIANKHVARILEDEITSLLASELSRLRKYVGESFYYQYFLIPKKESSSLCPILDLRVPRHLRDRFADVYFHITIHTSTGNFSGLPIRTGRMNTERNGNFPSDFGRQWKVKTNRAKRLSVWQRHRGKARQEEPKKKGGKMREKQGKGKAGYGTRQLSSLTSELRLAPVSSRWRLTSLAAAPPTADSEAACTQTTHMNPKPRIRTHTRSNESAAPEEGKEREWASSQSAYIKGSPLTGRGLRRYLVAPTRHRKW